MRKIATLALAAALSITALAPAAMAHSDRAKKDFAPVTRVHGHDRHTSHHEGRGKGHDKNQHLHEEAVTEVPTVDETIAPPCVSLFSCP
ncbi:MAG: hypothetical protein JJE47_09475 [Acidimicrobiia bacterium]|nr:hypothetical protein [Acidimicrobiia bacterium]